MCHLHNTSLHTKVSVTAGLAGEQIQWHSAACAKEEGRGHWGSRDLAKPVVCIQRTGLTRPRHRASSCRADLCKTFFMPTPSNPCQSQTTLQNTPYWLGQSLTHRGKSVPVLGAGNALFQQVAQIKILLKRQVMIQSCQRRKEGGRASPSHIACFLDSLALKSRAGGVPERPLLFFQPCLPP